MQQDTNNEKFYINNEKVAEGAKPLQQQFNGNSADNNIGSNMIQ